MERFLNNNAQPALQCVTPAEAELQNARDALDSRFRGNDRVWDAYSWLTAINAGTSRIS